MKDFITSPIADGRGGELHGSSDHGAPAAGGFAVEIVSRLARRSIEDGGEEDP